MRLILALLLLAACRSGSVRPDVTRLDDARIWQPLNAETRASDEAGRAVVRLYPVGGNRQGSNVALLSPRGIELTEGTIEVDLKGGGDTNQTFVGLAFNLTDAQHYEAVYFRPFNFHSLDPVRRGHAVQYVAWPDNTWESLRRNAPGRYEAELPTAPAADAWFHLRLELDAKTVRVYVNDATTPCLKVDRLAAPASGKLALFVDSQEGWFSHLSVTPSR